MVSGFCICLYCPIARERWANRDAQLAIPENAVSCGHVQKNTLTRGPTAARERVSLRENLGLRGIPPPPSPCESLDWGGVCKNGLQNLEGKPLRGQNPDNKGLAVFFAVATCTASALTIFCLICSWTQGQMSHHDSGVCGFRGLRMRVRSWWRSLDGAPSRVVVRLTWATRLRNPR